MASLSFGSLTQAVSPASNSLSPSVSAFSPSLAAFPPVVYSPGFPFMGASDMTPHGFRIGYSTPHASQSNKGALSTPTEQAKRLRDLQQKWQAASNFFYEKEKCLASAYCRERPTGNPRSTTDASSTIDLLPVVRNATAKPYTPGVMLAKSAECSTNVEFDGKSECSTADSPPSPEPEPAYVSEHSNVSSDPKFNLAELPNVGSAGHYAGDCKPCAFFLKKGCDNGSTCEFCHLCDAGEKKRRMKEKKAQFKSIAEAEELMIIDRTSLVQQTSN